jgi:hypothetical protein
MGANATTQTTLGIQSEVAVNAKKCDNYAGCPWDIVLDGRMSRRYKVGDREG